ncbi:MAG: tetratricopeptide repeat protein [Magnetococcales bacterium]|nr:tetratricopeptide repeat protein [Magnetococcales bacterium]
MDSTPRLHDRMREATCPACGHHVAVTCFQGGEQPLATLAWPASRAEAQRMPRHRLDFVGCVACGHVFNVAFDYARVPYSKKPNLMFNLGAFWSEFLQEMLQKILQTLPERPTVVEIGHEDGHFLDALARARPDGRYHGFDPNGGARDHGPVRFHATLFDPARHLAELAPDLIISRHVLEHLVNPLGFLQGISFVAASLESQPLIYLEVPCIDQALASERTVDFYYEHSSQFTTRSFTRMLTLASRTVLEIGHGYNGEIVYGFARLGGPGESLELANASLRFLDATTASLETIRAQLAGLHASGAKVAIWGGTGKAAAFMCRHQADRERFPVVIDSDLTKVGTHVPGTGQKIRPPGWLLNHPVEIVIVPPQWRAADIAQEMATLGIAIRSLLIEHHGRLIDFHRDAHPYHIRDASASGIKPTTTPPVTSPLPDEADESLSDLFTRGLHLHRKGQLEQAAALYHTILARNDQHADSLHLLGVIAFQQGDAAESIRWIRRAIGLQGHHAAYHANLGIALKAQGKLEEAARCHRQALTIDPGYVTAHALLGEVLKELGRVEEAIICHRQVLRLRPDSAKSCNALGLLHTELGQLRQAETWLERALEIDTNYALAHYNLGNLLRERHQPDQAMHRYRQALALQPTFTEARFKLGLLLHNQKRFEEAVACYRQVIQSQPEHADAQINLGILLKTLNRPHEALPCFEQAVRLRADHAECHHHLGTLHLEQGRLEAALACFRQTLALQPEHAAACLNLGTTLHALGQLEEAEPFYRRALAIDPNPVEACNNLGSLLMTRNQTEEAIHCFLRALSLRPDHLQARINLGSTLRDQGRVAEAVAQFQEALKIQPSIHLELLIAFALPPVPESVEAILEARARLQESLIRLGQSDPSPRQDPSHLHTLFHLAYHGLNDRPLQMAVAALLLRLHPSLAWRAPHLDQPTARTERIRLGVLSSLFNNHTIEKLNKGILLQLDKKRFELILFRPCGKRGPESAWMENAAERVIDLPRSLDRLQQTREMIAAERLELLFYPDIGMDPLSYLLAFSRLARVQCVTWGHPVTTGIPAMDYFISSVLLEPEENADHYSEKLFLMNRLPTCYLRPAPPAIPATRPHFGLPEQGRLYLCPQSLFKFHPEFDHTIREILLRDPEGYLVLIAGKRPHWTERLQARLRRILLPEELDRVLFLPQMDGERYLALLTLGDVMLDPFHFGGGNTTYEALAVGTPIITWPSAFMRGRVTLGCYRLMGMSDLVADRAEYYVQLALRMAMDRPWRQEMVEKIQARASVLYEDIEAVRELEAFFISACEQASGAGPLPESA